MKKLTFLLIGLLITIQTTAQSDEPCESCLPEGITFTTQAQIDSFQINYPNCTVIEGDVMIDGYFGSDIVDLGGLSVLISIEGRLSLIYNDYLTSLIGLENVTSIGGRLLICANDSLTSLVGLENLITIGGDLNIGAEDSYGNPYLSDLTGLDNVTSIGGNIYIWSNSSLTSLTGLENVTSIAGSLAISGNDALTSLTGLDNVTSIEGALWIESNGALTSLTGLDNIYSASIEGLYIIFNPLLSKCEVESVCAYLANPNGEIWIEGNAIGCNNQTQVQDSCEANAVSIPESNLLETFNVNPNPFTTSTTLSFRLSEPENVHFTVYNVQSQIVYTIRERREKGEQNFHWIAEGLPAGMYYFRIQAGERFGSGKVVVMK